MKKILFLTDYSEVAKNAFVYALSVAEKLKGEVHIVHIASIYEIEKPEERYKLHPFGEIYNENLEKEGWGKLVSEAEKYEKIARANDKLNVSVYFHFEKGKFLEVVNTYIKENRIDMVVMGTSGANTVDKKLFGSNTANLIHHADIPILAIPANAKFEAVSNFSAAVLLKENEHRVIKHLLKNATNYGYTLNCVHVTETAEDAVAAKRKIPKWLASIDDKDLAVMVIESEDVGEGLKDFIENNNTHILCIIHRHLPFFQRLFTINYSKYMLQHSQTALLIYNHNF